MQSGLNQGPCFASWRLWAMWEAGSGMGTGVRSEMPRLEVPFYTIKHVLLGNALLALSVEGKMSGVCRNFKSAKS